MLSSVGTARCWTFLAASKLLPPSPPQVFMAARENTTLPKSIFVRLTRPWGWLQRLILIKSSNLSGSTGHGTLLFYRDAKPRPMVFLRVHALIAMVCRQGLLAQAREASPH